MRFALIALALLFAPVSAAYAENWVTIPRSAGESYDRDSARYAAASDVVVVTIRWPGFEGVTPASTRPYVFNCAAPAYWEWVVYTTGPTWSARHLFEASAEAYLPVRNTLCAAKATLPAYDGTLPEIY